MRTISAQEITDTVARLCIEANTRLPQDVQAALDKARQEEPWPLAKSTLDLLWSNLSAAKEENLPICQDTGMACVFVELGTDVHIDGSFEAAIHEGVRRGYTDGYLRKSIVADPLRRGNTGDNTPGGHHSASGGRRGLPHHGGTQGLWQREHEPDQNAQACRRRGGLQKVRAGHGEAGRLQPLPAHRAGHRRGRQL